MTEINKKYLELYEWWFNPSNKHCWFDATEIDDSNIVNLFGELIQIDLISQINLDSLDFKQSIGFILDSKLFNDSNFTNEPKVFLSLESLISLLSLISLILPISF